MEHDTKKINFLGENIQTCLLYTSSRIYKARERSRELFDIADDMKELEPAEKSFLQGDEFFTDEHLQLSLIHICI